MRTTVADGQGGTAREPSRKGRRQAFCPRDAGSMLSAIRTRLRRGRSAGGTLSPAHGVLDQFGGGNEVEFLLNLFTVVLDGLDAEMKCARYLAGGLPLADQMQDLALAIRETLQRGGLDGRLVARLLLE